MYIHMYVYLRQGYNLKHKQNLFSAFYLSTSNKYRLFRILASNRSYDFSYCVFEKNMVLSVIISCIVLLGKSNEKRGNCTIQHGFIDFFHSFTLQSLWKFFHIFRYCCGPSSNWQRPTFLSIKPKRGKNLQSHNTETNIPLLLEPWTQLQEMEIALFYDIRIKM